MDNIFIKQGTRSPEVAFDFNQNTFEIKGESYPEDVNEFYGEIMDKLEKHLSDIGDASIKFLFEFIYFNSSTAKILMTLFELLDEAASRGNVIEIIWRYERDDDNMQELGEEFSEELKHASFTLEPMDEV